MALSKGKIYKYDLNGNFIKEYESAEAASFLDNISSSFLLDHLKGKWSFCHNHIYSKKYYIKLPEELLVHNTKRIYKTKKIYQYSKNGEFLNEYKDKNDAAEKTGLISRYIRDYASGHSNRGKTYGGFIWSYEKKKEFPKFEKKLLFKKIHQYSKTGKFIKTFNSIKEASLEIGISSGCISHCARGSKNTPSAGGYIWKYEKI